MICIDPPIIDGDKQWIGIEFSIWGNGDVKVSGVVYLPRLKNGKWGTQHKRLYGEDRKGIPAHVVMAGLEASIADAEKTIERETKKIDKYHDVLADMQRGED